MVYLYEFEFDVLQASYLLPGDWRQVRPAQAAPQAGRKHRLQGLLEVTHIYFLPF